jgi:signal transduction histidine kinase
LGLIDDVLDMAKIEAGHTTLHHVSFNLLALVSENIEMMRRRAADKGLQLTLQSSPAVPRFIRTDAVKLRQILINLIGNAVKFTEVGTVTIRLDTKPTEEGPDILLQLEVRDTGTGIAPEDQGQIFDAFVQTGHSSLQKGTGLGLSITRQFIQLMGAQYA